MGGAAHKIHQGGHADKTAADAEDTSQPAGEEADENGQPCRAGDVGLLEVEHGRNLDGVQARGPVNAGSTVVKFLVLGLGFAFLLAAGGDIMKYKPGQQHKQHHVQPAHNLINRAQAFQPHDHLRANFDAHDGTNQHGQTQAVVNVAKLAVTHGGDKRFTRHLRNVCTNGKGHGETENVQAGGNHPRATHTEKAADNTHAQTKNYEARPENEHTGDGHQNI